MVDHYFEARKKLSMKGVDGAPDWYGFETTIWKLSEKIRLFLKGRRDLKGKNLLMDVIVRIVIDRRFGKGRQNFILIIGDFGDVDYSTELRSLIDDPDVGGQVIKTLSKLKVAGCAREIEAVLAGEGEVDKDSGQRVLGTIRQ